MLWKVILFLIILVVGLLFIAFNLGNRSDVSVGFFVWRSVPVFLSMLFSFALGVLCMVPFLLKLQFSRRKPKASPGVKAMSETVKKDEPAEAPPAR